MFQVEQLKNKNFTVFNRDYRFKEDWLLQAYTVEKTTAFDWIDFLDELFSDQVKIIREYYVSESEKTFEGPAGFKLEFKNKQAAQNYCEILNKNWQKGMI